MTVGYLPFSVDEIDIICGALEFRPIWRYGVELNGRQRYLCTELSELRVRLGVLEKGKSKVDVKLKSLKHELGYIWAFNHIDKHWFKVPHICPEYADGLTTYQHKIIKKIAKQLHLASDDFRHLLEAKEVMRQEVARLQESTKLSDQKKVAKIIGHSSRQILNRIDQPNDPAESFQKKLKATKLHKAGLTGVQTDEKFDVKEESKVTPMPNGDDRDDFDSIPNPAFQKLTEKRGRSDGR